MKTLIFASLSALLLFPGAVAASAIQQALSDTSRDWHCGIVVRDLLMLGVCDKPALPEEPGESKERLAHCLEWLRRYWSNPQIPVDRRLDSVLYTARSFYGGGRPEEAEALLDAWEKPLRGDLSSEYLYLRFCIALFGRGERARAEQFLLLANQLVRNGIIPSQDSAMLQMQEARYLVIDLEEMDLRRRAFLKNEEMQKRAQRGANEK